MNIAIPFSEGDLQILSDVIARLGVLYPNVQITTDSNDILISDVEPALEEGIKQTALDQLIRSRFDFRTLSLRENLYNKLLG